MLKLEQLNKEYYPIIAVPLLEHEPQKMMDFEDKALDKKTLSEDLVNEEIETSRISSTNDMSHLVELSK